MTIIKYVGLFIFGTGFAFKIEKRKRKKRQENPAKYQDMALSFEEKHNINCPGWLSTLLIVIGVIFVFGSNFHLNIKDFNGDTVLDYSSSSSETKNTQNEDDSKLDKEATDNTVKYTDITTSESLDKALGNSDETMISEFPSGSHLLKFNDGQVLCFEEQSDRVYDDGYENILPVRIDDIDCIYADSFINIDDLDTISNELLNFGIDDKYMGTIPLENGGEVYIGYMSESDYIYTTAYVYQNIGASSYLKMTISGKFTEDEIIKVISLFVVE